MALPMGKLLSVCSDCLWVFGALFHLGYLTSLPSFLLSSDGWRYMMYIYKKRIRDESNISMAATTVNPKVV